MAGNDPHVHGAGNVRGPQEVGHEAPRIDGRIQNQGAAAGRAGRTQGADIPTSDGLHLTELDDEGPAVSLSALLDTAVDPLLEKRRVVMTRLRDIDVRIDETEQRMQAAIYEGRTRDVETRAVELTALFRDRVRETEELERIGEEMPLESAPATWVEEADEREAQGAPSVPENEVRLAGFIDAELEDAQSPLAGRGVGALLVAACSPRGVDPLLLLAVAAHESGYGRHGERCFGVGAPNASVARQIDEAATAFASLRAGAGDDPDAQVQEAWRRGWSQEPEWALQVMQHHDRLSRRWQGT